MSDEAGGLTGADIDRLLAEFAAEDAPSAVEVKSLADRLSDAQAKDAEQNVGLKKILAWGAMGAVGLQLVFANYFFHRYGSAEGWHIESAVMISWLTATVIESIGVLYVIAKHLFPDPV